MRSAAAISLCLWIILVSAGLSDPLPDITDMRFVEDCVRAHNGARASVQPPAGTMLYMTWDEGLAITARAWARHCLFKHNIYLKQLRRVHPTFPSVGENIWASYPTSMFNTTNAIKSWVDEKLQYNFNSNTCSGACGHYTQVVWAQSYKVGCAVQHCPSGVKKMTFSTKAGAVFVCNYAPAGNVNGNRPYQAAGTPCSGCKDVCEGNLCRSKERDSPKSYRWTPDWDPALKDCGSGCAAVLTVRPVALICTFIVAYVVHHFYPNIFCYE